MYYYVAHMKEKYKNLEDQNGNWLKNPKNYMFKV